ncbi:MAG TPA: hypothetical protein VI386_07515 [Candidatus Sulfotelmatobacter sp.]
MWGTQIASNMNFPAPLAVIGFLAACGGSFAALAAAAVALFIGKPRFARLMAIAVGAGALGRFGLLAGFSLASKAKTLARGREKYFCEIDCHLAYSVTDVKTESNATTIRYKVTLRTRFDETTISPTRSKEALLSPSPREVRLLDDNGREFAPVDVAGTPLSTPLKPADSYTSEIQFEIPKDAAGMRLLVQTKPQWPDRLVIGEESSFWHQKAYLAL